MPTQPPEKLQKAIQAMGEGDGDKVVDICRKLLKKNADHYDVRHLLGIGFRIQGRMDLALREYEAALTLRPEGTATLFCNLAFAYLENESASVFKADDYASRARSLAPELPEAYEVSADVALRVLDTFTAQKFLLKACELRPNDASLLVKLAKSYRKAHQLDAALMTVKQAVEVAPQSFKAARELADTYEERGDTELALEAYNRAKALASEDVDVDQAIINLLSTHGRREELIHRLQHSLEEDPEYLPAHIALLRSGSYPGGARVGIAEIESRDRKRKLNVFAQFSAANAYEKQGDTEESFRFYLSANRQKQKKGKDYNLSSTKNYYGRLRTLFNEAPGLPRVETSDWEKYPTPVFVLGMPRSGTSLTEQLLGSHSQVYPAGELQFLLSLTRYGMRTYVDHPRQRTAEYWTWVRETYLRSIKEISDGSNFVIDKMPHNYEMIGFIKHLFPHALIIHCCRDPIANCLSIFKANFAGYHPYAQNLKLLGDYYAEYRKLMRFWESLYGDSIHQSVYESLVTDTRTSVTTMLSLCGLEWEDGIKNFHESDRIVRTASNDQVRQPIYQSSIKGWKIYEKQLKPLIKSLLDSGVITEADLA